MRSLVWSLLSLTASLTIDGCGRNEKDVITATGGASGAGGPVDTDAGIGTDAGFADADGALGNFVDINGMSIPQEKAIAFIHFGHSNMSGRGRSPASLRPYFFTDIDARAWMYHATGDKSGFHPAAEPHTAGDTVSQKNITGGPGTPLVKQAAAMAPGYHFISVGFAAVTLQCEDYAPGSGNYNEVMAGPKALAGKVTFAAIVVMLGITERHGNAQSIQNYPACINTLITQIRNDLSLPNLPLLLTDYEMTARSDLGEDLAPTGSLGTQLIPRIHTIPSFLSKLHPINYMPPSGQNPAVANSALVPTDGLSLVDDRHFELNSQKIWTQNLLDIMKEAGWFPWGN